MKKSQIGFIATISLLGIALGIVLSLNTSLKPISLSNPLAPAPTPEPPLQKFAIPRLSQQVSKAQPLTITKLIAKETEYSSYLFHYQTGSATMSGQINIPNALNEATSAPVIVMLRGYIPADTYKTGDGTRPAAAVFAKNGFITIAPDFLGVGESSPEPEDSWLSRFQKPVQVLDLISSLQTFGAPTTLVNKTVSVSKLGIWGHSNGGQIALTVLEAINQPIPTTLWAPVTAPFPYSVLFFSDEVEDEGKAMRKWVSIFEDTYNVFDFSLSKHVDRLQGPLQLHHGTADEAALHSWSTEFIDKIDLENARRTTTSATASANASDSPKALSEPIDLTFYSYPNTDHNMRPSWDTVVKRDLDFFTLHLLQ